MIYAQFEIAMKIEDENRSRQATHWLYYAIVGKVMTHRLFATATSRKNQEEVARGFNHFNLSNLLESR
jgi:hypothetical protein